MRLLLVGTVPDEGVALVEGPASLDDGAVRVGDVRISRVQGTGAMAAAALAATTCLGVEPPTALLAWDTGKGDGSRALYRRLTEEDAPVAEIVALHYMLPILSGMTRAVDFLLSRTPPPLLIADAGAMYAAKSAGLARRFAVFTPDPGEMSFLADPEASHPAYVQRHLFAMDTVDVPSLLRQAHASGNVPQTVIVKGVTDYIYQDGQLLAEIREPCVPALEPIGGTGDTITGMLAGFLAAGLLPAQAAECAARCNRAAGMLARPTPATSIAHILDCLPEVIAAQCASLRKEANRV